MIPETNVDFAFFNKCAFVSAYKKVKQAMAEIEGIADSEIWQLADELACRLQKEIDRDKVLTPQLSGHGVSGSLANPDT
jgi:hypothetical protein